MCRTLCLEFAMLTVEFCLAWTRNTVFEFLTSARPPQSRGLRSPKVKFALGDVLAATPTPRPDIAMATTLDVVLPGDVIPQNALPTGTGKKKTLTLGPGLRHIPPNTVTSTVAGTLVTDNRKNAALVEYNSGRVSLPAK